MCQKKKMKKSQAFGERDEWFFIIIIHFIGHFGKKVSKFLVLGLSWWFFFFWLLMVANGNKYKFMFMNFNFNFFLFSEFYFSVCHFHFFSLSLFILTLALSCVYYLVCAHIIISFFLPAVSLSLSISCFWLNSLRMFNSNFSLNCY